MKITDVRVRKVYDEGKMRGIVSVTFDDVFVVHDIKVIEGQNGYFIAMPSRKTPDGEFKDICHPITSDMRGVMQTAVLNAYEEAYELQKHQEASEAVELTVDYEDEA